jgi:hypothetical protein
LVAGDLRPVAADVEDAAVAPTHGYRILEAARATRALLAAEIAFGGHREGRRGLARATGLDDLAILVEVALGVAATRELAASAYVLSSAPASAAGSAGTASTRWLSACRPAAVVVIRLATASRSDDEGADNESQGSHCSKIARGP